jgi:citronellyl-CoA synthetase
MTQAIKLNDLFRNRRHFAKRAKGALQLFKITKNKQQLEYQTYASFFEQQAARYPNNIAIKYVNRRISYNDVNLAANRIAHYLQDQGLGKGDTIALFMENRPEYLIYQLAISKLGAIAALINNTQRGKVLIHSVNLVNCKIAIVGEELLATMQEVKSDLCIAENLYVVPDTDTLSDTGSEYEADINITAASADARTANLTITQSLTSDLPAWYIYTSGTTGLPKASVQSHGRVIRSAATMGLVVNPLTEDDTVYSSLPMYHITALSACWFASVYNGASLALTRKFSASRFWADVANYQATSFGYVGELCRYLLNQPESALEKNNTLHSIVGNGLRPEIWNEFKSRFGIDVVNEMYGASEGNIMAFNMFNLNNTIGMVMGPYKLVKVDQETEEPVRNDKGRLIEAKKGEPGLLLGKIDKLTPFDGYSDKSKNDSKVIRHAFKHGDSYFNTGDVIKSIGYKQMQFCDRTGDTFRWKGENVSTQEIEEIANSFSAIAESVAYGVEIPNTNGKAGMVAIKLNNPKDEIDGQALFTHLSQNLPSYAIPVFARIKSELERTPTFKYQKVTLKKDGFNVDHVDGPVYVLLPGEKSYQRLTRALHKKIMASEFRF